MAIGWWLFMGDPGCALVSREPMSAGVLDCGALMLANPGLLCRGDLFKSGGVLSGEVRFESVNGRQSAVFTICGEPIVDGRLTPPYCSMLLA
jgi:hypothetical protein